MHQAIRPFLDDQSGVVTRKQALAAGLAPHDLARLVRRRELAPLHPGVFVDHTGQPTFLQRAWGGVLLLEPAALAGHSALRAFEGPGSARAAQPVQVVVAWERRVRPPAGIEVARCRAFEERVQWNLGPPRLRYEEAALDVAAEATSDLAALGELSRVIQSRRTTAARLQVAVERRTRYPRRRWIIDVLGDVAAGTCSVLEHGYLHRVERPHGLAPARRQVRDRVGPGVVYRDVLYECGVVGELDGRLFHDTTAQRDRDYDRDLVVAGDGGLTVRMSYGQVFDRACWTAFHIGRVLARAGWTGTFRRCGPTCGAPG
ncbi:type IV toxin-antitoxin system AbiEi family antitoxin domain-containing protein [Nocardioides caldifontis]|uniref:type IV toxin-antitoxin system AbiEi family antitoxin domain-containing protein n=1 Tax=Nocardioides caldifontis TaxID=2588938 RepID=UPI0011DFD6E5|nr:type IV toxin-antitoxin system AbiEi family antitoxin domain-containing protein [Nocardioides caldifontis]